MNAITVLAFLLSVLALGLFRRSDIPPVRRVAGHVCAAGVGLIGGFLLATDLGVDLGFPAPRRAAPTAAVGFLLLSPALLLLGLRQNWVLPQILSLAVICLSLLSLIGHLYGVTAAHGFDPESLPSAALLLLLGAGVVASEPDRGVMTIARSNRMTDSVARRLIVAAIGMPILFGWLRTEGQRAGLYGTEFGTSLAVLANLVGFTALVVWAAVTLERSNAARGRAETALRESEARFHRTFDHMLEGCQIIGFDWRYLYVNDSVVAHARRTREELVGKTMMEVYPGIETTSVFGHLRRCMEERVPVRVENRFEYPDGFAAWFDVSIQPGPEGIFVLSADITDRKRAEGTLRKLAKLIEHSGDFIALADLDGRITFMNDGARRMIGLGDDDDPGSIRFTDYVPPQWQAFFRDTVIPAATERGLWEGEMQLRHLRTGATIDVHRSMFLIRDEHGRPEGFASVARDITEHKRAAAALRESEARFRGAFDHTNMAMVITDLENRFLLANEAFARLFGYTPEEMRGMTMAAITHPDDLAESHARRGALMAGYSDHLVMEKRYLRRDGRPLWGLTNVSLLHDQAGEPIQYVRQVQDITDRKQAESRLRETTSRLQTLLDALPVGVSFSDDVTCERIIGNPAVLAQFAVARGENLSASAIAPAAGGRRVAFFRDGQPLQDSDLPLQRAVAENRAIPPMDLEVHMPDGRRWFALASGAPIRDPHGAPTAGIAVTVDVTDRKLAEEEIRRLNDELERRVVERTAQLDAANKELEAFSYSVSHDLRAPLRAIDGFCKIVVEDHGPQLPSEALELLHEVRANTKQMGRLVDDLLAFSRLSRKPVTLETVDTADLVQRCLNDLRPATEGRRIGFRVAPLPECQGDPALLKQVWINLLANAVKYTGKRDEAVVEVGSTPAEGDLAYFVRDNGVGFDMRYAHKLFGVFQRLHRAEEYEGTGVGLAIVQRIVHRHGGRIWAEAKPGAGATFFFTVPSPASPLSLAAR